MWSENNFRFADNPFVISFQIEIAVLNRTVPLTRGIAWLPGGGCRFSLVLRGNNHRRIKRSGVASEFAVHPAGEVDASH